MEWLLPKFLLKYDILKQVYLKLIVLTDQDELLTCTTSKDVRPVWKSSRKLKFEAAWKNFETATGYNEKDSAVRVATLL